MENEQHINCSRNNYSFTSLSKSFLFTNTKCIRSSYGQGYDVKELKDSYEYTEEEEEAMEEGEE